jgi:hypothetical protein
MAHTEVLGMLSLHTKLHGSLFIAIKLNTGFVLQPNCCFTFYRKITLTEVA